MVRSVIAEKVTLNYLSDLAKSNSYNIGLILGQSTPQKDFVFHLAKTPEKNEKNTEKLEQNIPITIKTLNDIQDSSIAEHAKYVTRMLPGGMWVLGIFIVGPGDVFIESGSLNKIKLIISKIKKILSINKYLYAMPPNQEILTFHLNSDTKNFQCKSYNPDSLKGSLQNVDWKFQEKPTTWLQLECHCDFEQTFAITDTRGSSTLKKYFQEIIESISQKIHRAICIIDGEMKDLSDLLDSMNKKKKGKVPSQTEEKIYSINFYIPCQEASDSEIEISKCHGEMNFLGILGSRVFVHQKATVEDAIEAVRQDIIRSLASRLEMHCDSLVNEEDSSLEEKLTLHEPPRRVLIPLPNSKITLSEYLFPGEGASEALNALQELLDVSVKEEDVEKDIELPVDPTIFSKLDQNLENIDNYVKPTRKNLNLYLYYILAVLSVIIAIFIGLQFTLEEKFTNTT